MTTIYITPVGSSTPELVDKKDFLGALENCDPVNNIIIINGKQYALNTVEFGVSGLEIFKFTKTFADFKPNATTTGSVILFEVPAGAVPVTLKTKHSVKFLGGAINSARIRLKSATGNISSQIDVFTDVPGNSVGAFGGLSAGDVIPDQTVPSNLLLELVVGSGVINDLTQGSVDGWVLCFVGV